MRNTQPDEQGWYWAKMGNGEWAMAFVDTGQEEVTIWNGDHPYEGCRRALYDEPEFPDQQVVAWYGPFNCPGGDFGSPTIVVDEKLHSAAASNCEAIALTYVDYQHCDDGNHESIALIGRCSRQEADQFHANARPERWIPVVDQRDNLEGGDAMKIVNHVYRVGCGTSTWVVVLDSASGTIEADLPAIRQRLIERHGNFAILEFSSVEYLGSESITDA